ncbi:MAG: hypothetical protein ABIE84_00110 [bacterium]
MPGPQTTLGSAAKLLKRGVTAAYRWSNRPGYYAARFSAPAKQASAQIESGQEAERVKGLVTMIDLDRGRLVSATLDRDFAQLSLSAQFTVIQALDRTSQRKFHQIASRLLLDQTIPAEQKTVLTLARLSVLNSATQGTFSIDAGHSFLASAEKMGACALAEEINRLLDVTDIAGLLKTLERANNDLGREVRGEVISRVLIREGVTPNEAQLLYAPNLSVIGIVALINFYKESLVGMLTGKIPSDGSALQQTKSNLRDTLNQLPTDRRAGELTAVCLRLAEESEAAAVIYPLARQIYQSDKLSAFFTDLAVQTFHADYQLAIAGLDAETELPALRFTLISSNARASSFIRTQRVVERSGHPQSQYLVARMVDRIMEETRGIARDELDTFINDVLRTCSNASTGRAFVNKEDSV